MQATTPLIVGAGPTGLAAALFLARRGVACRIVDKAEAPASTSKALAVNPRTLELLEPTGVSERIMAEGRAIRRVRLMKEGHVLATLDPGEIHARFPMTALPQSRTEALLTEALAAHGVAPERSTSLEGLTQDADAAHATLTRADGRTETVAAPILFGADGAHSRVREALGIGFPGSAFPEPWRLADVKLKTPVEDLLDGYVDLKRHGFVFTLAFNPSHWRVIANQDDPLNHIPGGAEVKEVVWTSAFHISHRIAERLAVGRTALGGDAAHLHSPVGARGMNLGIEDAYVFAELAVEALAGAPDRLADYGRLRHATDQVVVRRIEAMTRMVRGEGLWSVVREVAPHLAGPVGPLRRLMEETVAGLDHPVELS